MINRFNVLGVASISENEMQNRHSSCRQPDPRLDKYAIIYVKSIEFGPNVVWPIRVLCILSGALRMTIERKMGQKLCDMVVYHFSLIVRMNKCVLFKLSFIIARCDAHNRRATTHFGWRRRQWQMAELLAICLPLNEKLCKYVTTSEPMARRNYFFPRFLRTRASSDWAI